MEIQSGAVAKSYMTNGLLPSRDVTNQTQLETGKPLTFFYSVQLTLSSSGLSFPAIQALRLSVHIRPLKYTVKKDFCFSCPQFRDVTNQILPSRYFYYLFPARERVWISTSRLGTENR
jgi:hypothetical protein